MTITLNGQPSEVPDGTTIAQAVTRITSQDKGIAVAVNGEVVPRAAWSRPLADTDRLEVVTAVQGG